MIDTVTAQQKNHQALLSLPTVPVDIETLNPFGLPQDFVLSGNLGERVPLTFPKARETIFPHSGIRSEAFSQTPIHGVQTIDELFNRLEQASEKDLRRNPQNIHLLTNAGVSHLNAGDLEKAKGYFEKALQQNPKFLKAQLNLAKVYHLQGNIDKAIEIYVTLQQQHPNNPSVLENLTSLYIEKGAYESCLQLVDKLKKIQPDKPSGHFLEAILHLITGNAQNAVSALRKAARLDIHHASIHNCLGACYAILGSSKKAIRAFQTALTIAPDDREATLNLAQAYEQAFRDSDSVNLLEAYVERHQTDWDARDLLARAFFLSGDYKKSLLHLSLIEKQTSQQNGIGLKPHEKVRLYNNLALVYTRLGEEGFARECYERCLTEKSDQPSVYSDFAMFLLSRKQFKRADEVITEMEAKFPDDSNVTLLKGHSDFEQERFDDAVDYLRQAVELRPNDVLAPCLLGAIYSEIHQDYRAAIALFKDALTRNPKDARLLNNLAYNYLMADKIEPAREVLDQANEQDSPIFLNATRGLLLIKEGNHREGQRFYNRAAKLASADSKEDLRRKIQQKKFLELARYELKRKQLKPARKYLNEVMKLKNTDSIFQQQARDLQKQLEA